MAEPNQPTKAMKDSWNQDLKWWYDHPKLSEASDAVIKRLGKEYIFKH